MVRHGNTIGLSVHMTRATVLALDRNAEQTGPEHFKGCLYAVRIWLRRRS